MKVGALGRSGRSPGDHRDIRLSTIVDRDAVGAPKYVAPQMAKNWTKRPRYDWLANDRLGCCTITGIAHLMQNFAYCHGEDLRFSDSDIIAAYSGATGYDPARPETDRGGQMVNALTHARAWGIGGRKIGAFVRVDYYDTIEMQAAIYHLGGVYVGARLPLRVTEDQGVLKLTTPMTERDAPGSLGGHAFALLGYDRLVHHTLLWRDPRPAELAWSRLYVDEAWAIIDERWISGERPAPTGFRMDRLRWILEEIGK